MIYFIKSGNYCKIGFTRDAKALFTRLRTYLTHNPSFQILDLRKGDKIVEKINFNDVALEGGVLNCTTWVYRKDL